MRRRLPKRKNFDIAERFKCRYLVYVYPDDSEGIDEFHDSKKAFSTCVDLAFESGHCFLEVQGGACVFPEGVWYLTAQHIKEERRPGPFQLTIDGQIKEKTFNEGANTLMYYLLQNKAAIVTVDEVNYRNMWRFELTEQ